MLASVSISLFWQIECNSLTVLSFTATIGTKVNINECNGAPEQNWIYSSQGAVVSIRLSINPGSCLIIFLVVPVLTNSKIRILHWSPGSNCRGLGYWLWIIYQCVRRWYYDPALPALRSNQQLEISSCHKFSYHTLISGWLEQLFIRDYLFILYWPCCMDIYSILSFYLPYIH